MPPPPRATPPRHHKQDALGALLHATRGPTPDTSPCPALRGLLAARLPGMLHALPADAGPRVKELVLVAMAELEHLAPPDRIRLANACLSGFEEGRGHALLVLELLPPCLHLIPPGLTEGGSQGTGGEGPAGAVDGAGAPQGTPPAEPSSAHRCAAPHACSAGQAELGGDWGWDCGKCCTARHLGAAACRNLSATFCRTPATPCASRDAALHRLLHAEWRADQVRHAPGAQQASHAELLPPRPHANCRLQPHTELHEQTHS